ncbi:MAG: dicarboxylate/amino acid:cation symporter [Parabacteroides sp.]|nr:dicarboxylate/amino acid:cation symporter [Parabacteroides sp.]
MFFYLWVTLHHYGPAYLTALGTMSSAATLGTALKCAGHSSLLRKEVIDVTVPLFANIHLCGSILTETFFVMTVSQVLYGCLQRHRRWGTHPHRRYV